MQRARRRRTTWAALASVAAHVAVLTLLALQKPMLVIPAEPGGPPPPVIPVLLMPHTPPPGAGQKAAPAPIRLHRRPQRFAPPQVTPLPIPLPAPPPAPASPPRGPVTFHPAPQPESPKGDARMALRQGPVGCANPLAVGLNRAERDLCDDTFGKGVRTATPYATGTELSAGKRALLDKAAAAREADDRYKRGTPVPLGPPPGTGASAEDMSKQLGMPQDFKPSP